jgi:hypothetical protein
MMSKRSMKTCLLAAAAILALADAPAFAAPLDDHFQQPPMEVVAGRCRDGRRIAA